MSKEYTIYSEFDALKHKETFVNYLEVLISPEGKVLYAVPSHQMLAEKILGDQRGWTHEEVAAACPKEYYFDYMTWLLKETGYISVWNRFFMSGRPLTKAQKQQLQYLKSLGIYGGSVTQSYGCC